MNVNELREVLDRISDRYGVFDVALHVHDGACGDLQAIYFEEESDVGGHGILEVILSTDRNRREKPDHTDVYSLEKLFDSPSKDLRIPPHKSVHACMDYLGIE